MDLDAEDHSTAEGFRSYDSNRENDMKGNLKQLVLEAARTRDARVREQVARAMKRQGLTKVRAGDVEARLVEPRRGIQYRLVSSPKAMLDLLSPPKKLVTQGGETWSGCKVEGCSDDVLAKGLCQKHYGRARRKQPLDVEPRRGLVQLVIHVEPELKRWLKKTARRDKVSVSQRASMLLQSEKDNLDGKSPF